MNLETIIKRFARGLEFVDRTTTTVTMPRDRERGPYLAGVPSMTETAVTKEVTDWWVRSYPADFYSSSFQIELEVPYLGVPRAKCDFVIGDHRELLFPVANEWAVEVKRIQLLGNNGNNNDYGIPKLLSPYLKDRSLIHDLRRMQSHPLANYQAALGYVFTYSFDSLNTAHQKHENRPTELENIRKVLHKNDPGDGIYDGMEIVMAADAIFSSLDLTIGNLVVEPFRNLWRHPCGGNGFVFAWEVKPN